MAILKHLDKLVCVLLVVLTAWYIVARFQSTKELRRTHEELISRAQQLDAEISRNPKDPPERDAELYSGVPKSRWSSVARVANEFKARHFYPVAPDAKSSP